MVNWCLAINNARIFKGKTVELSELISEISHKYHSRIEEISGRSKYLTDKTCMNFVGLGFLLAGSPNLRVVSIIRDPMAVACPITRDCLLPQGRILP